MQYKILCNNQPSEINSTIAEERHVFTVFILSQIGLPLEEDFLQRIEDLSTFSSADKEKLREILLKYGIQIIESIEGELEIYLEDKLVAKWNKPFLVLKKDPGQIDPKKKLYIELNLSCWSVFENEE